MDKMVDDRVRQCHSCLIANSDAHPAPVATEEVAESPWSKMSLMMVLMDNYTKYPVVEII